MVYIIMVRWCVIGTVLSWCYGVLFVMVLLSWYNGMSLLMVYIIMEEGCVIGDGLYHHGTLV